MVCGKCETVGVGATTTRAKKDVFAKSFYIVGREFISRRLFDKIRGGTKAPPYGIGNGFALMIYYALGQSRTPVATKFCIYLRRKVAFSCGRRGTAAAVDEECNGI